MYASASVYLFTAQKKYKRCAEKRQYGYANVTLLCNYVGCQGQMFIV